MLGIFVLLVAVVCAHPTWTSILSVAPLGGVRPKLGMHYSLDLERMKQLLTSGDRIEIPVHNGTIVEFRVADTTAETMAAALASRYPDIRTFHIKESSGLPMYGEISISDAQGFHAQIICRHHGRIYVDPIQGSLKLYTAYSYNKNKGLFKKDFHNCGTHDHDHSNHVSLQSLPGSISTPTSSRQRLYRAAFAASNEYCQYHGGSVSGCLSAVVAAIARVNGIYKRELSVAFQLVANNDDILCTNCASSSLGNTVSVINQAYRFINLQLTGNQFDSSNYDIGHVFTTGSGGLAGYGVICTTSKASATTGSSNPVNDAFWLDYVAHEVGHQFHGTHTWNGNQGFCTAGSRTSTHAYEIGSGSTIMAYAGICNSDDLQPHSDANFHIGNLDEMQPYIEGLSCGTVTASSNNLPNVLVSASNIQIPKSQPFTLTAGTTTDADNNTLLWSWEQIDLGSQAALGSPASVSSPRFRAYPPVTTKSRSFPNLQTLVSLGNGQTYVREELLASATGTLNFAVVVRDHFNPNSDIGYGSWDADKMTVTIANYGPLKIQHPSVSTAWGQNVTGVVTWSVAGTNNLSPTVDILLSVDNGVNFVYTLGSGVFNNGSYSFTTPCIGSNNYRNSFVMVKSQLTGSNYWFDVSPKFIIASSSSCTATPTAPPTTLPPISGVTPQPTPATVPTPAPTKAPTPKIVTKVEWVARFPSLSYSDVHSNMATNQRFVSAVKRAVSTSTSISESNVVVRYISRMNSGSNVGILADSHADFDAATQASQASSFHNTLNSPSGASSVYSTANGWDASFGTPSITNVSLLDIRAPDDYCGSNKCYYVAWEAFHPTSESVDMELGVFEQVVFFWEGDESLYQVANQTAYDNCYLGGATKLTTVADEANRMYGFHAVSSLIGTTVYIVSGASALDHIDSTLCQLGLKAKLSVVSEVEIAEKKKYTLASSDIVYIIVGVVTLFVGLYIVYFFWNEPEFADVKPSHKHVKSVVNLQAIAGSNKDSNPSRLNQSNRRKKRGNRKGKGHRSKKVVIEQKKDDDGLPENWKVGYSGTSIYYYNTQTGESQWDFPEAEGTVGVTVA